MFEVSYATEICYCSIEEKDLLIFAPSSDLLPSSTLFWVKFKSPWVSTLVKMISAGFISFIGGF